ncbi:pyruvate dehydrogenase (acetyl-transferring), homodimeric type [Salinibius halmophilus]|uniref:pyruvate dehydrogenase (acetyl-transferring), homodimeric type n=1 Tax=Salinibius halmophilus TaxID=1853216 RepID=UPI000E660986|nr:pyruvate dehydrogenase (acetyl-transferring), homodimeric type [Salinibius halmophilus]
MEHDIDPIETQEWLDALASVVRHEGSDRAQYLLKQLSNEVSSQSDTDVPFAINTPYRNTISVDDQPRYPGDLELERRIQAVINWNAVAMVVRANKSGDDLGGHMSSFQSSALLYDIGFNHFWRAPNDGKEGDLIYYQGHIAPGIYARSFVEGRLTEDHMDNFRREVDGKGLSSYPHPWLMPDYWQFPTVSMGLGPIQAIYQAHVMRYLNNRGVDMGDRRIWAFLGDGECDEPETLGAISLAAREKLNNLTFVINCNLQRLDGPVRGNGKIIQELEGVFRGAGWNVVKVIWGAGWDKLFARDKSGLLQKRMDEVVDGEMQAYKAHGGAYTREHFFGKYPELLELVKDMTDDEIYHLARGGHDAYKVYAAYKNAVESQDKPTVILAHTVKGYGITAGEAQNSTHQLKKLDVDSLKAFRDRCGVPITDEQLEAGEIPFYRPDENSDIIQYMKKRRLALGGYLPQRRTEADVQLEVPSLDAFKAQLKDTGDRQISTTMALVRMISTLAKDKKIGDRIVPIVPDEARTFGMEGMFRQIGIYAAEGQKYIPQDKSSVMWYKEDQSGQILQEGINEAGAFSSWLAAATSYSSHNHTLIPFYFYYSMFGFQRIGDLAWAAGDMQARGFLIGGTSGRTTLNGEGLQHQDGHSHIQAGTIPNCVTYDATFSYEVAVIVQDGLRRMVEENESVYYYITTLNENYAHPAMPEGAEEGIKRGMYLFESNTSKDSKRAVQLLGSGSIFNEVTAAAELLKADWDVDSDIWSVTSYNELTRDGLDVDRHNMLNADGEQKVAYVTEQLQGRPGPVISSGDYMKNYANQIRAWVPSTYRVLGTDGFGRSDSRKQLRHFFEVNRYWVTVAALKSLADDGVIEAKVVAEAINKYGLDINKPNPVTV